jgi:hypothetical protein
LDESPVGHQIEDVTPELIATGKELVTKGYSKKPQGEESKRISEYFVCTSCHNIEREDPDLQDALNPKKRLKYCSDNKLPFLQGTTLWGVVNRVSWYNDDYILKYGDLLTKARSNLAEATQLCAQECSQGRVLEEWELKAILAFYWNIGVKMNDLDLPEELFNRLNKIGLTEEEKKSLIVELKTYYSQRSCSFRFKLGPVMQHF